MLEAQLNTPLDIENTNAESNGRKNCKKRKLSELKIPFIFFFQEAVRVGVFNNLGDMEKLKKQCEMYRSYIDRWLADAIKKKDIKILADGVIESQKGREYDSYEVDNQSESYELLGNITNKITEVALKDAKLKQPKGISSCHFYSLKNDPDIVAEYKSSLNNFLQDVKSIAQKSANLKSTSDKLHYVSLSACTLDEEVLSEM